MSVQVNIFCHCLCDGTIPVSVFLRNCGNTHRIQSSAKSEAGSHSLTRLTRAPTKYSYKTFSKSETRTDIMSQAAFTFMRIFYPPDFVRTVFVTKSDQTIFNIGISFCADFRTDK